jgi:ATP-dependent Lhr-like helicase
VLLGADPPVRLTARAAARLAGMREDAPDVVHPAGSVIRRDGGDVRWWTWAGYRANATLVATLPELADPAQRPTDFSVRLRPDMTVEQWRSALVDAGGRLRLPEIEPKALAGLKFGEALPPQLARATLAARLADLDGARQVLTEPTRIITAG